MSSGTAEPKQEPHHKEVEDFGSNGEKDVGFHKTDDFVDPNILNDAYQGENREHEMGSWEAAKKHPMACLWAFIFCFTIVSSSIEIYMPLTFTLQADPAPSKQVMESFDMFLNGNFVALKSFQERYGELQSDGSYAIATKWQSSLFQAGQCGAFVGVFLAGPITNRLGYRWTTILALILMNATIFISFFVSRLVPLQFEDLTTDHMVLGGITSSPGYWTSF